MPGPAQKRRSITITGFSKPITLANNVMQDSWPVFESAIRSVFAQKPCSTSEQQIYASVETIIAHKLHLELHKKITNLVTTLVDESFTRIKKSARGNWRAVLDVVAEVWIDQRRAIRTLHSFCLHLDAAVLEEFRRKYAGNG